MKEVKRKLRKERSKKINLGAKQELMDMNHNNVWQIYRNSGNRRIKVVYI